MWTSILRTISELSCGALTPKGVKNSRSAAPDLSQINDYRYDVDPHGDNALAYVLEFAGRGKKILELGAGSGMQTQFLTKDKRNYVVVVERDLSLIDELKKHVDRVYALDLNDSSWVDHLKGEGSFDAIIAADVLEHLYDPWNTICEMKKLLSSDGEIIVSLPYVGNSAILGLLYQDDFEYKDQGLLDKTHIRFFCLRNIAMLHENAGLTITDARFVLRPPETTEFHERWKILPSRARKVFTESQYGSVYQVVTTARPSQKASTDFSLFKAAAARCSPRR